MAGKPGRSGTNKGKDKIWSEAIRRAVLRTVEGSKTKRLDQLADKLVSEAADGNVIALKEIGDRLDGKAVQAVAGPDGGPVTIRIVDDF
jgi:hypothetical protein